MMLFAAFIVESKISFSSRFLDLALYDSISISIEVETNCKEDLNSSVENLDWFLSLEVDPPTDWVARLLIACFRIILLRTKVLFYL